MGIFSRTWPKTCMDEYACIVSDAPGASPRRYGAPNQDMPRTSVGYMSNICHWDYWITWSPEIRNLTPGISTRVETFSEISHLDCLSGTGEAPNNVHDKQISTKPIFPTN